jgi:hypothetical protein
MTYATGVLLHVRRRRDPLPRYRGVFKTLAAAVAAVVVVLASITAVVVGIGRTSAAFVQTQSSPRAFASLSPPPTQLARADISAGAIGTRWPVIADLMPVSPTITVASVSVPEAARVAAVAAPDPVRDTPPVKIQDRFASSKDAPSGAKTVTQAALNKPAADLDYTGSLGTAAPKLATADVGSITLPKTPGARADAPPAPMPQPRPRLASLPPAGDLGIRMEGDPDPAKTAIYDIVGQVVYLPNGEKLEAHSGLGNFMDDPRSHRQKNRGVTPPNTYKLKLREALFHGVQAIRLTPVNEDIMFGRDGMLAHTYMLGPSGQSNGCVSFKEYPRFLRAFLRGEVEHMVVVARLDKPPKSFARANTRSASNTFFAQ